MSRIDALGRWERRMRADGASSNTLRARLGTVLAAARHAKTSVEQLTLDDVDSFLARPHLSQNSRAAYYQHLSAWFDHLLDEGLIDSHPLTARRRRRPKVERGLPRPLTDGEVEVVMDTAPAKLLDLMQLGLKQGCRVSEAVAVRGEHFAGDRQEIRGKGQKLRIIPVHPDIQELRERKPATGLWFPSHRNPGFPVSKEGISTHVGLHFRNCSIPAGSFQRLRHTYATRLHRQGVPTRTIQVLLGHAFITTTEVYTQVGWDDLVRAVACLPSAAAPPVERVLLLEDLAEFLQQQHITLKGA